jgi:hypothetical protein
MFKAWWDGTGEKLMSYYLQQEKKFWGVEQWRTKKKLDLKQP